jgi:hypothetical protein
MRETWLRPNRRAILFGCVPPLVTAAIGAWIVLAPALSVHSGWRWVGVALIVVSLAMTGLLTNQLLRPRIAFHDGAVLFNVRSGPPIAVPADVVEAFFLGQGPAHLPGAAGKSKTVNLMARLSQRRTEWARQEVKPALGSWSDGYVTIRGAWCEPLDTELVRKLNRRLKEVKDEIDESKKP